MERHNTGYTGTAEQSSTKAADRITANAPTVHVDPRLHDHAKDILAGTPELDDAERANLWDAWHDAPNADALARRLAGMDLPEHIKQSLVAAKELSEAA